MLAQSLPLPNSARNGLAVSAFSYRDVPVRNDLALTKSGGEWREPVPAALVLMVKHMAKTRRPGYSATKIRQGAIILNGPVELAIFMAGLFGSVALLLIALLLHL
jgi:hypothetical protein